MSTNPLTPGTVLTLTIDALATGGQAIARHNGMAVFIDRGIPGQTVEVTITKVKKRFAEATHQRTITRAPDECQPFCSHFGLCGGCQWQHLPYAQQVEWKTRFVTDSLKRIGGAETLPVRPAIASPLQQWYRNKMEFAFLQGRGVTHVGLRRIASHSIVNVTDCRLQSERCMDVIRHVRDWANASNTLPPYDARNGKGFLRHVVVRETKHTGQLMVQLITTPDWSPSGMRNAAAAQLGEILAEQIPGLTSFIHSERTSRTQVAYGERTVMVQGAEELEETLTIGGQPLHLGIGGADAFFQTNTHAAEALFTAALDMAAITPDDTVWDLYCGVGAMSLAAARTARHVSGFELSQAAVDAAARNATRLGLNNVQFHAGDVLRTMDNEATAPNVIISDPPRGGMHPDVVAAILRRKPERLVLVACDPATQARDIGLLREAYTLTAIQPVDMFPHTPHIENIVLLNRW